VAAKSIPAGGRSSHFGHSGFRRRRLTSQEPSATWRKCARTPPTWSCPYLGWLRRLAREISGVSGWHGERDRAEPRTWDRAVARAVARPFWRRLISNRRVGIHGRVFCAEQRIDQEGSSPSEVESEGHAEKDRAVIEGYPTDELIGQRRDKVEPGAPG
jgi:hypothetical protein